MRLGQSALELNRKIRRWSTCYKAYRLGARGYLQKRTQNSLGIPQQAGEL